MADGDVSLTMNFSIVPEVVLVAGGSPGVAAEGPAPLRGDGGRIGNLIPGVDGLPAEGSIGILV